MDLNGDDQKIRIKIGWLNTPGGFQGKILYDKVSAAAKGLDGSKVLQVLEKLEGKEDVKDPNAWVCSALRKEGGGSNMDLNGDDQKIRRKIGWLNTPGGFQGKILYDTVSAAANGLDGSKVLQVLEKLEGKDD